MAYISENARKVATCPFCKELLTRGATRCPHCHENLFVPPKRKKRPFWLNNFFLGVYTGSALWIAVIIYWMWKV